LFIGLVPKKGLWLTCQPDDGVFSDLLEQLSVSAGFVTEASTGTERPGSVTLTSGCSLPVSDDR
jgi:hypothetical protein